MTYRINYEPVGSLWTGIATGLALVSPIALFLWFVL